MKNKTMNNAKVAKKDEFYTQLADIEKELKHYKHHFKGKVVFCNCDDPDSSGFWQFFYEKFKPLGLKKLVATHYHPVKPTYKLEYNGSGKPVKKPLKENGDFRSPECIKLLKKADIVVTNPPFSLFREYITTLMEFDKKFIIIGNMNAIAYKEIRPFVLESKIWFGAGVMGMSFMVPDCFESNNIQIDEKGRRTTKLGFATWFTNLPHNRLENEEIALYKSYNPKEYPTYDNYDAIEVSKVNEIPDDYSGEMGVPRNFFQRYNPNQFELIGFDEDLLKPMNHKKRGWNSAFYIKGKRKFSRLVVKRKGN